ncbi:MAG: malto-oligosyltrehalose trehalohydrolase [Acidobacteria bacterium]|nr:MAG: malto-oligosyltrehalose trehalohydrolase [Acidobacteriota bacterium]
MSRAYLRRRLTVGAELQTDGGADVRVWAPAPARVELVSLEHEGRAARTLSMTREPDGHFNVFDPDARPGGRYWFRLDGERLRPDPASRCQPDGPHEPSQYIDPSFPWTDSGWKGVGSNGHVIYELHVGTFTREGTWAAAAREVEELARIGITIIEMMPIADFAGRFGWGYDGVDLFAPTRLYGTPHDLRAFIDRAHALGVGVILDVVYNHLGPDGNYLDEFSPDYFTAKYTNDWGRAINFEGPPAAREFFVQNAGYWIDEFHFDGLRLDATQDIKDASREHVIASVVSRARQAASSRSILMIAENEPQDTRIIRPRADARNEQAAGLGEAAAKRGGYGADALWNDDAHHAAVVALTGRREAYYRDYLGSAQELISCARFGYLYQGQYYSWQSQRRGTPALDLMPHAFVTYLENHDQVANSAFGRRLHQLASPARYRAVAAWMLLGPSTPMLFQGQEFSSSRPFLYFADHKPDLAAAVRDGRVEFLGQFPSLKDEAIRRVLPPPTDIATFEHCKLDLTERRSHASAYRFHGDLMALRRSDPVLARAGLQRPEGAVLGPGALVLRYINREHGDRLVVVNLDCDLDLVPAHEPLMAPPWDARWRLAWSSEAPEYDGQGTADIDTDKAWTIPGGCALLFTPEARPHQKGASEEAPYK